MKTWTLTAKRIAGLIAVGAVVNVHAALLPRLGGEAFYDTDLGVTWLANANLAAFEKFGLPDYPGGNPSDGRLTGIRSQGFMNWYTAMEYVDRMRTSGYLGVHNWRLPRSVQPDPSCTEIDGSPQTYNLARGSLGYGCYASELGHLFREILDSGMDLIYDTSSSPDPDDPDYQSPYAGFKWMRKDLYWTETPTLDDDNFAFQYYPVTGTMNVGSETYYYEGRQAFGVKLLGGGYVLPVMDGDINDVLGISTVPLPAAAWLFGSGLLGLVAATRKRRARCARAAF